jgi:lysozyme
MKTGSKGIRLIKAFEACELSAYPDPASPLGRAVLRNRMQLRDYALLDNWKALSGSPWTIGYGHTGPDVKPGDEWSQDRANHMLVLDIEQRERDVNDLVKVPLTQEQFDALVSFVFNVGSDIDNDNLAEGLGDSTLLRKLNAGDYAGAAEEFEKWKSANGQVLKGLARRRLAERRLFEGLV